MASSYFRDLRRVAPHNLYAHTSRLLARAPSASRAHDIGFRFGPAPAGGRATASFPVSYPAASFTFRWSAQAGRWLVWMDGTSARAAEGGPLSVAGTGVVLRGGKAYPVRWSRPDADAAPRSPPCPARP